eukprot:00349_1
MARGPCTTWSRPRCKTFWTRSQPFFSRRSAPPPPLMRHMPGSTASAPSIDTSSCVFPSLAISSSVMRGILRDSASFWVAILVGMHVISLSLPSLSFCPTLSTANLAVDPVPRPTSIPLLTWSSTALYPAAFF